MKYFSKTILFLIFFATGIQFINAQRILYNPTLWGNYGDNFVHLSYKCQQADSNGNILRDSISIDIGDTFNNSHLVLERVYVKKNIYFEIKHYVNSSYEKEQKIRVAIDPTLNANPYNFTDSADIIYSYDTTSTTLFKGAVIKLKSGSKWINYGRRLYYYDNLLRDTLETMSIWDSKSSNWIDTLRIRKLYSGSGGAKIEINYLASADTFKTSYINSSDTLIYDTSVTHIITRILDKGKITPISDRWLIHDKNHPYHLLKKEHRILKNNQWIRDSVILQNYYSDNSLYPDRIGSVLYKIYDSASQKVNHAVKLTYLGFITNEEDIREEESNAFSLSPNPAINNLHISYSLPNAVGVEYSISDVLGRTVLKQDNSLQVQGEHNIEISNLNLAPGIYNVTLLTGTNIRTKRLVILK